MASSLQQRLVGGRSVQFSLLYPDDKQRFEKFDTVFGREAVELVKFDRASLVEGDMVADFGHRIRAPLAAKDRITANVGMSLEAAALLYAYRRFGPATRDAPIGAQNMYRLIAKFFEIGSRRIALDADAVAPILASIVTTSPGWRPVWVKAWLKTSVTIRMRPAVRMTCCRWLNATWPRSQTCSPMLCVGHPHIQGWRHKASISSMQLPESRAGPNRRRADP
jgi:hypothetical protein